MAKRRERAKRKRGSAQPQASKNKVRAAARNGAEIPTDLADAIKQCWPQNVVEEFGADESYFNEIHGQIERDLRNISGASLIWQTEEQVGACSDDDEEDEPLRFYFEWQSYHVFFMSPDAEEFCFEDETITEDPEGGPQATYPGEGRFGLALTISLAAPVAMIDASSHSRFEDGTIAYTDPASSFFWDEETGKPVSANEYHRDLLGLPEVFQKLEALQREIVSLMSSHRISVLDESVLDLTVKGLRASSDVFLQKPLRVRDAFFFRGV